MGRNGTTLENTQPVNKKLGLLTTKHYGRRMLDSRVFSVWLVTFIAAIYFSQKGIGVHLSTPLGIGKILPAKSLMPVQ